MTIKITQDQVESWLREMGCTPRAVTPPTDPSAKFQVEHDFPVGTPHRLGTICRVAQPRALIVVTTVAVSPEHIARFKDLERGEQVDFILDLFMTLNREFVEFVAPSQTGGVLTCPPFFQISATRYDDALSLDSFARTVSSVYKSELAGILCVQKHLTPPGSGPEGDIQFKRTVGGSNLQ